MWKPPVTCPQELRKRTRRNGRQQAENHHRYHRRSRRIHREAASSSPGPLQTPLRALSFTAAGHTASPSPGHAAPGHGIGVPWPPDEFGQPHQRLRIRSRSKAHEKLPPPFTTTPLPGKLRNRIDNAGSIEPPINRATPSTTADSVLSTPPIHSSKLEGRGRPMADGF